MAGYIAIMLTTLEDVPPMFPVLPLYQPKAVILGWLLQGVTYFKRWVICKDDWLVNYL